MEQHYAYDAPPHGHQPHHSHHSSYDARPQHPYSPPHSNPQSQSQSQSQYPMPPPPQSAYPPPPAPYDPALDYRSPPPSAGHYTHSPTHAHTHTLPQPLPSMTVPMEHNYGHPHVMDTTGQLPPNGMRPRLTTSVFEEEGSICFQVDVDGICVARREDNHMINGTKLLNVARMTRGRRDGILKAEKQKNVVKIGPMHLKGVWIPFERALSLANQEKITEQLYPLFVHNIGSLLYHPSNAARVPAPAAQARAGALADGAYRAEVPRGQEYPGVGAAQGGYAAPGGYAAANGAAGGEAGVEGSRQEGERL